MADDIEEKRRELHQLYGELEKLEYISSETVENQIRDYRERTRRLAEEIADMEPDGA